MLMLGCKKRTVHTVHSAKNQPLRLQPFTLTYCVLLCGTVLYRRVEAVKQCNIDTLLWYK